MWPMSFITGTFGPKDLFFEGPLFRICIFVRCRLELCHFLQCYHCLFFFRCRGLPWSATVDEIAEFFTECQLANGNCKMLRCGSKQWTYEHQNHTNTKRFASVRYSNGFAFWLPSCFINYTTFQN